MSLLRFARNDENYRIPTLEFRIPTLKFKIPKQNSRIPTLNSKIPRYFLIFFQKTLKFLRILTIYFTQIGKDAMVCSHRFITPKS